MGLIAGVHGVAQQFKASELLRSEWEPALRDGVSLVGGSLPAGVLTCASYGEVFRRHGNLRGAPIGHFRPSDVTPQEAELLALLVEEATRTEPDRFPAADAPLRASTPGSVQAMLRLLTKSRFLVGVAADALIGDLKQVTRYMNEPKIRDGAQQAVDAAVSEETRVIIAHSLGTVVAYEALGTYAGTPRWANIRTLVTLGSPLGIPNLIFEKLRPEPSNGKGHWPADIERWTNISDDGDIVALLKKLRPLFGDRLVDVRVDNGSRAHDVGPYLTARETGAAILDGLA